MSAWAALTILLFGLVVEAGVLPWLKSPAVIEPAESSAPRNATGLLSVLNPTNREEFGRAIVVGPRVDTFSRRSIPRHERRRVGYRNDLTWSQRLRWDQQRGLFPFVWTRHGKRGVRRPEPDKTAENVRGGIANVFQVELPIKHIVYCGQGQPIYCSDRGVSGLC